MWLPAVEGTPLVQNRSFIPIGTPASGLSVSPAARALSAASAAASACSGVSTRKALSALALVMRAEKASATRSEEHTSELQTLMRISYAVFCLKKKNKSTQTIID